LIPEVIGRLPVIATVEPLDRVALMDILTVPKNALTKQYQRMFELDGFELEFDKPALELMADMAIERETGARGLRAILETVLGPIMFEIPTMEQQGLVKITKDVVLGVKEASITPFNKQAQEKSA
jgi:ATP-dependent Clp protease ATP-binding subunit ClpX